MAVVVAGLPSSRPLPAAALLPQEKRRLLWSGWLDFEKVDPPSSGTSDGPNTSVSEVAEMLSRFIKADLAEDLSLAMIRRKFPGLSREELLRVFAICQDEVALEYERSQELLANMRETTAGYAALFALADLWHSHSVEQRRLISDASPELADTLDQLNEHLAASSRDKGWELLTTLSASISSRGAN